MENAMTGMVRTKFAALKPFLDERRRLSDHDPGLVAALERLIDPVTGDDLRDRCGGPARVRCIRLVSSRRRAIV